MNVPIMIASHLAVSRSNSTFSKLVNPAEDDLKWVFRILSCLCFVLLSLLMFLVLDQVFKVKTQTIVEAKIVQASVEQKKKSNGYRESVVFKIEINGQSWNSGEKILFSQCSNVIYNQVKPIFLTHVKSWVHDYYETSGMRIFCQ